MIDSLYGFISMANDIDVITIKIFKKALKGINFFMRDVNQKFHKNFIIKTFIFSMLFIGSYLDVIVAFGNPK
jgi:hypothetical protein